MLESMVRRALDWLFRIEVFIACGALALVVVALLADVVAREVLGSGLFGVQRFAVYSNAIAGLLGFAIVVHTGGHLRVSVVEWAFPAAWQHAMARMGDAVSALLCVLLGYLAVLYVGSSYTLGETDSVFNVKIWSLQLVIPYLFATSALRYACYAVFPDLRPEEKGGE